MRTSVITVKAHEPEWITDDAECYVLGIGIP